MAAENSIMARVRELVEQERGLRERVQAGELSTDEERAQLQHVEAQLDQCWDLLRQRRARVEAGQDPDDVEPRPVDEVEGYLQ